MWREGPFQDPPGEGVLSTQQPSSPILGTLDETSPQLDPELGPTGPPSDPPGLLPHLKVEP